MCQEQQLTLAALDTFNVQILTDYVRVTSKYIYNIKISNTNIGHINNEDSRD